MSINNNSNVSATDKELIATLFQLSMTQPSYELDVFINIHGHVKSIQIYIIHNCKYEKEEEHTRVFNQHIYFNSKTFTQDLRETLANVLNVISKYSSEKLTA